MSNENNQIFAQHTFAGTMPEFSCNCHLKWPQGRSFNDSRVGSNNFHPKSFVIRLSFAFCPEATPLPVRPTNQQISSNEKKQTLRIDAKKPWIFPSNPRFTTISSHPSRRPRHFQPASPASLQNSIKQHLFWYARCGSAFHWLLFSYQHYTVVGGLCKFRW